MERRPRTVLPLMEEARVRKELFKDGIMHAMLIEIACVHFEICMCYFGTLFL